MNERLNRRDDFIDAAARLFMGRGYVATSVREIAAEVGCTEAALYYHFKDGKRALLRAVVENYAPDLLGILDGCEETESLADLVVWCGQAVAQMGRERSAQLRWVSTDYVNFSPEERELIQEKHLAFQRALTGHIQRFVPDEQEASHLAWLLIFATFGQLVLAQHFTSIGQADHAGVIAALARSLDAYAAGYAANPSHRHA